jgi:hypothetical protein
MKTNIPKYTTFAAVGGSLTAVSVIALICLFICVERQINKDEARAKLQLLNRGLRNLE